MRLDLQSALKHIEQQNLEVASATSGARKLYPGSAFGSAPAHRTEAAKQRSYTAKELEEWESDRGLTHPLADRNLPELQMASVPDGPTVGALVLGCAQAGKTSLIHTLEACVDGRYSKSAREVPLLGLPYAPIPVGDRELQLTDTRSSGPREELKLTADVHPNSMRAFNAIPQWLRLALRQRPHTGVVVVLDGAAPLWEDLRLADQVSRLVSVLLSNGYRVSFAVTKLLLLRNACAARSRGATLDDGAFADLPAAALALEPTSCYETFTWRYLQRVHATLRTTAERMRFPLPDGYPRVGTHLLDVPTFRNPSDLKLWQAKRATRELPNLSYAVGQLMKLAKGLVEPADEPQQTARTLDLDRPHIA